MRILVVQESDWLDRGPLQSHHLMERLSQRGHEIKVIDSKIRTKENKKKIITHREVFTEVSRLLNGGKVTLIRPPIIMIPIIDYLTLIYSHYKEIGRQIKEFNPDIIIGFGILNANIAIMLAKQNNIPFAYYIIDELHRLVPQKFLQNVAKFIEKRNMYNSDKVISINEGLREYTVQMGTPIAKTKVIRAGIEVNNYNSSDRDIVRDEYNIKQNDIVLFFMGLLYDFTGLKELSLDMANTLNSCNIKLLTVGKGDLWNTLQSIKKEFKLENRIITLEWKQYEELPKYLAAADICILPALNNPIMKNIVPIKMYEYMAAKKPVISTALPGIMKEFGLDNGVVYVNKPQEVIAKARELAQSGMIETLGLKAKNYVQRFSWDVNVDEFQDVLEELIKEKRK